MDKPVLQGLWASRYSYHGGLLVGEHEVRLEPAGKTSYNGRSLPDESGSELTFHLEYDTVDRILTGTWMEKTSPEGQYKGAVFHGTVQFVMDDSLEHADGKWLGFNRSHDHIN